MIGEEFRDFSVVTREDMSFFLSPHSAVCQAVCYLSLRANGRKMLLGCLMIFCFPLHCTPRCAFFSFSPRFLIKNVLFFFSIGGLVGWLVMMEIEARVHTVCMRRRTCIGALRLSSSAYRQSRFHGACSLMKCRVSLGRFRISCGSGKRGNNEAKDAVAEKNFFPFDPRWRLDLARNECPPPFSFLHKCVFACRRNHRGSRRRGGGWTLDSRSTSVDRKSEGGQSLVTHLPFKGDEAGTGIAHGRSLE